MHGHLLGSRPGHHFAHPSSAVFKFGQTLISCWHSMSNGRGPPSCRSMIFILAASTIPRVAAMLNLAHNNPSSDQSAPRTESPASHRRRPLRVLFVHRDADTIDSCLEELKKGQFAVTADFALNLAQCAEYLHARSHDVIVAEYPGPNWKRSRALHFLDKKALDVPLLFLATAGNDSVAQLTADGGCDFVEREHLAQLPMAVRRILNEKKLREELEETRTALHHSQSLYRALADNPTYGIYRCDVEGKLLDVNFALIQMLGFADKAELLAANQESEIIPNLRKDSIFAALVPEQNRIEPVELEWKRKDGATLKARLSGRGIYDDHGNFSGHEVIVMDVTEQRTLEDQLRHQASSDSLTGLANHRRLFEVLHAEICRSKRTGREFSLLLLDLDGLKKINDQFGHLVGDRAICRLSQVVLDCSRSIDTAARQGGDELALVLPETGSAAATIVARRICDLVRKDSEHPALSVSVGIASYPIDAESIGTLLYAADRALYEMKAEALKGVQTGSSTSKDAHNRKGADD
jgi:diguanylate cyclase (GGDEF)-like protein/PAS domain S-box-containing protein